jgi:truncated hemoglobin YjbI
MIDILYAVNTAANLAIAAALVAAVIVLLRTTRRRTIHVPEPVDTPEPTPEPVRQTRPAERPASPRNTSDYALTQPPMVEGVTLRAWMMNHHPLRDGVWSDIVREFYNRAAAVPEIADYFRNANMEQLQRHFTRALAMVSGAGLSAATLDALAARHARVTDSDGRHITPEIYDAVIATLVGVLGEAGVPRDGIAALGEAVAPLRAVIAHPSR